MLRSLSLVHRKYLAQKHDIYLSQDFAIAANSGLLMEAHSSIKEGTLDLPGPGPLRVGAYSYIRGGSRIMALQQIGRFCSIGRNVVLGEAPRNHPLNWVSTSLSVSGAYRDEPPLARIGNDVWIAHNAVIMAGVRIGDGAVIGCNAVVTRDVEPYQIVAGNPARPIRYRFDARQRGRLLASEWWNVDREILRDLPFNDVDAFLAKVAQLKPMARYPVFTVSPRRR